MQPQDKDSLKAFLPQYLAGHGIEPGRAFHCLNPGHNDRHPSMRYDRNREAVHCFSCGSDYDLFDLVGIEYGLSSFPEKVEKTGELFNITFAPQKKSPTKKTKPAPEASMIERAHARAAETDYFARRGIGAEVIQKFQLGYDPAFTQGTGGESWQAVILPTGPDSFTARNTDPRADDRHRIRKAGESCFLGFAQCFESGVVAQSVVVEGEFDSLSLWEIGQPAVSLGSVANAGRFLRQLSDRFPDGKNAPTLLLALDTDEPGRKASASLLEDLASAGFRAYEMNITGPHKDPNEALVNDRAAFSAAVSEARHIEQTERERAKKAYLSNSSAAYLEGFLGGIAASVDTEALQTGFPRLDAQLDGGLYEGLYIIGAISSLGKTTLLLQIADQLARQGQDVLIFSLEMARYELMAKSVSRHTLDLCLSERISTSLAKTARGITTGKRYPAYSPVESDLIARAVAAYGAYAPRLFIHEGIGDIGAAEIRRVVRQHIEVTGNRPVVIIDYLQILAPHSERATDKQNTDRAVLELKRLSRDHKLPVLGISSFNRANYAAPVTMEAFKESGAIEYSSDVLVGLQLAGAGSPDFDVNAAKRENPRKVELVILKNRNGATGGRIAYRYYALFNAFVEQ